MSDDETVCPECGEPVSATANYCMHCYADLPWAEEGVSADEVGGGSGTTDADTTVDDGGDLADAITGDGDGGLTDTITGDEASDTTTEGGWTDSPPDATSDAPPTASTGSTTEDSGDDHLLDPEGMVDNTLTIVVAIVGSIVIGIVGTIALLLLTESLWAFPIGFVAWLVGLAYLARQYSVQETIAKTFYGVAGVLLLLPFVVLGPAGSGGIVARLEGFVVALVTVLIPAGFFAAVGYGVLYFAPDPE